MTLYSTAVQTNAKESKQKNGQEKISGSEVKKCTETKENTSWCYLFIHHTKVETVGKKLEKALYTIFIHKHIVYKRENKKIRKDEQPTISGLLFIQGNCHEIQDFLKQNFFTLHLTKDCSSGQIAVIPDHVMQPFMKISEVNPTRIRFMPHTFDYYSNGNTLIRITSGMLAGLEGYRIRISRDKCFVTSIGGMTVAIGGIYKESFENLDEYVRQRRQQLKRTGKSSCLTLTPLQTEIDNCFFTPQNQLDILSIAERISPWVVRMKTDLSAKNFDEAVEIALFILEETGSRLRNTYNDKRMGDLKGMMKICSEADGILASVLNSTDVSADLKEIVETERESVAIRFPFLPVLSETE